MRVKEIIFGTKKPQSIDQSLILSLKKAVDNSRSRLQAERDRQRKNIGSTNHTTEKTLQIERVLKGKSNLKILELFCGDGLLSSKYKEYGNLIALDKRLGAGDLLF